MLQELSVKNFAIISELRVTFQSGMTVLTGETGAGKSIIIDAMSLLAGSRGSSEYIRQGAEKCMIEGVFALPNQPELLALLEALGVELEDELLIIQRDLSRSGKNYSRVNGRSVNIANLKKIGNFLVDIHGQHEHQELMQSEKHLAILDSFGGQELAVLKERYQKAYADYRRVQKKVADREKNEQEFAQRMDMLRFQHDEILAANLILGEEEKLEEEKQKLNNFQKITEVLSFGHTMLSGEETSSLDRVGQVMATLETIAQWDADYQALFETVQNSYYLLQEASAEMLQHLDHLELDENRLYEVDNRLELLRQLKRKYGETIAQILAYDEEITKELADADLLEQKADEWSALQQQAYQDVLQLAEKLHQARQTIAKELEVRMVQELKDLYLAQTKFQVRFLDTEQKLTESGMDQVEFYITTNPGEPLKPLVRVASGGELSRIMLAMKTIFSKTKDKTSIVFDEVDTGVSGRVAQAIADKIHHIAQDSQVLCITHLPQVAAVADYQYFIEKKISNQRTQTTVHQLNEAERIQEIARMLAGPKITPLTIEHAKELLAGKK